MADNMDSVLNEITEHMSEEKLADETVKEMCLFCGKPIVQNNRGRKKKFCSNECRNRWHSAHPNPQDWSSTRIAICPVCGKEFLASRESPKPRKYCSHACANKARAGKRGENETNS